MRDLRVLELAGRSPCAYCGRLFAATGADVVLAEPAEGAPTRRLGPVDHRRRRPDPPQRATHEYLDAGKRSRRAASPTPTFDAPLRWADVVVSTCDGDVDAARALHDRVAAADPLDRARRRQRLRAHRTVRRVALQPAGRLGVGRLPVPDG